MRVSIGLSRLKKWEGRGNGRFLEEQSKYKKGTYDTQRCRKENYPWKDWAVTSMLLINDMNPAKRYINYTTPTIHVTITMYSYRRLFPRQA